MTRDDIKQLLLAKLDHIVAALRQGKDVLLKTSKNGVKIQALDYKIIDKTIKRQ